MITISISEARAKLPQLVNRTFAGEEFLIVKNQIPAAKLVAVNFKQTVQVKKKVLPEAFGMWKDLKKDTVDIANSWRSGAWRGSYDS